MFCLGNGSHHSDDPGYFEWWYFHFVSFSGKFAANVVLHETDIFGLEKKPYVSLSVHMAGQPPEYYRSNLEAGSIDGNTPYLSQRNGLFIETPNTIEISLDFGELVFNAKITKAIPPLELNKGILYQDNEKKSHWTIQDPGALFTSGELIKGNKRRPFSGWTYHDHQWGNLPIQNFVSDWIWGHFNSIECSATYFIIKTQEGEVVSRYDVVGPKNDRRTAIDTGQNSYLDRISLHDSPDTVESSASVIFPSNQLLVAEINPKNILRSRMNEKYDGFSASYIRWSSRATLTGCTHLLRGITEYLRIRKGETE